MPCIYNSGAASLRADLRGELSSEPDGAMAFPLDPKRLGQVRFPGSSPDMWRAVSSSILTSSLAFVKLSAADSFAARDGFSRTVCLPWRGLQKAAIRQL
jgi:hypothetical protein